MTRFLIYLFSLFFLPFAWPAFQNFSIDNGLSQSVVFDIQQDQQGFVWFSTQAGLNRFDGNEFIVFSSTGENNSLTNNYIYPLALDNESHLFIGTRNGGVNQLPLYDYQFSSPILTDYRITSLFVDSHVLYIGTYDGSLFAYNKRNEKVTPLVRDIKKPIYAITKIHDVLWLGTHGAGLIHYDLAK